MHRRNPSDTVAEWLSDLSFRTCLERLEWEILRLDARDKEWSSSKQRVRTRQDKLSKADRAFSFIFVSGALESLFRELSTDLAKDLQLVEVRPHNLRPTSLSILLPKAWDSISSERILRLAKRRDLVDVANNFYSTSDPMDLRGIENLGLTDGRTVNVQNFEALWEGLCLSPSADRLWLSERHRHAVVSLAEKRNSIAHFETDPRVEAFRFSYADLRDLAKRISETVERLQEHTILWLDKLKK